MTSQKSDPLLEEIKRRALHLALTRGKLIDGDEGWEYQVQAGLVHVIARECDKGLLSVAFKDGGPGYLTLWHWLATGDLPYIDRGIYEEALDELRREMLLDDLADVRPDG